MVLEPPHQWPTQEPLHHEMTWSFCINVWHGSLCNNTIAPWVDIGPSHHETRAGAFAPTVDVGASAPMADVRAFARWHGSLYTNIRQGNLCTTIQHGSLYPGNNVRSLGQRGNLCIDRFDNFGFILDMRRFLRTRLEWRVGLGQSTFNNPVHL
jgi:hypothetical protein